MNELVLGFILVITVLMLAGSITCFTSKILEYAQQVKNNRFVDTDFFKEIILFTLSLSFIIWYCN